MVTLVLADVHANATALDAVFDAEPDVERVLFLGDAVDVGPCPDRAVSLLRSNVDDRVVGNHDRSVLSVDPGREAADEYERWRQWTRTKLGDENLEYLSDAPRTTSTELGDRRVRLHHGDFEPPADLTEWETRATPAASPAVFESLATRFDEPCVLLGHSHRPFQTEIDGTTFVNPGSVGLQRTDMRQDVARYAVHENGEFTLRTVEYDVTVVESACDELPLSPEFLASWTERYERPETE